MIETVICEPDQYVVCLPYVEDTDISHDVIFLFVFKVKDFMGAGRNLSGQNGR